MVSAPLKFPNTALLSVEQHRDRGNTQLVIFKDLDRLQFTVCERNEIVDQKHGLLRFKLTVDRSSYAVRFLILTRRNHWYSCFMRKQSDDWSSSRRHISQ